MTQPDQASSPSLRSVSSLPSRRPILHQWDVQGLPQRGDGEPDLAADGASPVRRVLQLSPERGLHSSPSKHRRHLSNLPSCATPALTALHSAEQRSPADDSPCDSSGSLSGPQQSTQGCGEQGSGAQHAAGCEGAPDVAQQQPQRASTIDIAALVGGRHRRTASQDTRALLRAASPILAAQPQCMHADAVSADACLAAADEEQKLLRAASPAPAQHQRIHADGGGAVSAEACHAGGDQEEPELECGAPEQAREERAAGSLLAQAIRRERQSLELRRVAAGGARGGAGGEGTPLRPLGEAWRRAGGASGAVQQYCAGACATSGTVSMAINVACVTRAGDRPFVVSPKHPLFAEVFQFYYKGHTSNHI